jgi:hypothetical protein
MDPKQNISRNGKAKKSRDKGQTRVINRSSTFGLGYQVRALPHGKVQQEKAIVNKAENLLCIQRVPVLY